MLNLSEQACNFDFFVWLFHTEAQTIAFRFSLL
jgi:hypothetical protein